MADISTHITREQIEYLNKLAIDAISWQTDESEGTQVVDIQNINACNPDYIDIPKPEMSFDDIRHLLHLDDPNVIPDILSKIENDISDLTSESTSDADLYLDGETGGFIAGDKGKRPQDTSSDNTGLDRDNRWNDISYPKDIDMQKVVDAIINDSSTNGDLKAVLEFATPSLQDPIGVEYELYVKPGQQVTEDTIIGKAHINSVTKEIKSIFSAGTVAANQDGTDFKHLYEGCGATRHIIIENYELCGDRPDINTDRIQEMADNFTNEAYIHQLITDNLPECVLPLILQNRYTEYKYKYVAMVKVREQRPNGREIFSEYEDKVNAIRDGYMKDIQNMGSEDNIRKTNGNIRKINSLGFDIIDRRKKYADDMIYMYTTYSRSLKPCEYDDRKYYDCRYLAYDHDVEYRDKDTNLKIGNTEYSNYYVSLLSKIDMLSSENNKYATEYYELIKSIIEIRMAREKYNIDDLINEFNSVFKKAINKSTSNAYSKLNKAMLEKKEDIKYSDVYNWIVQHTGKGKTKKSKDYVAFSQKQLVNIFLFIWNYHEYEIPVAPTTEDDSIKNMLDLVKEEWKKISEFWDKILAIHSSLTVDKCISDFEDFAKKGERYHNWPIASPLSVGYSEYDHFLFQNYEVGDQTLEDEDLGMDYETKEPVIADSYPAPEGEFGPEDLLENEDDVHDNEITVRDFKYWQKYFGLATIISIPFLNCGLDIPPAIMMIPLPCIFIAVASIFIQILDLVIVFGITIRGMYIFPCIFYMNCSSTPLSITTPLIAALKTIQSKINVKINTLMELPISSIANAFSMMMEEDNRRLRNENKQLDAAIAALEAKKVKNQANIKNMFKKISDPDGNLKQHINDPISALTNKV